ncbi:preprotein translocase subunit TatD [Spirochaetia bacterium]|nr:preprotein translocase subunit TatD [Spirochaetia bacterium]
MSQEIQETLVSGTLVPETKVSLIDIGANLLHRSFDRDRDQVIDHAAAAGVSPIIITGTSEESSRAALNYAQGRPGKLYATAGIHPHEARNFGQGSVKNLAALCTEGAIAAAIAVGECGLDYNRDFSPRDKQRECFEAQVRLASVKGLPLFLHQRDAFEDFRSILLKYHQHLGPVVVHCFTGSAEELSAWLELGCYIGITGWVCDERRGRHLLPLLKEIPADKLMLETDAPFLSPRTLQSGNSRNEPKNLGHIAAFIAGQLSKSPETLAAETTANARRFFSLPG